jgi:hypothetical protein
MSIFRLHNLTGYEKTIQIGALSFTVANNTYLDLLSSFGLDDLIGLRGGFAFEFVVSLIKAHLTTPTEIWRLGNDSKMYYYEQALHLLRYGEYQKEDHFFREVETLVTHDFCERQSWYTESTKVIGRVLTHLIESTYKIPDSDILINWEGGYIFQEDIEMERQKVLKNDANLLPIIYDNGIVVSKQNYSINYQAKEVSFLPTYSIAGPITIDYYKQVGSNWVYSCSPGYESRIIDTEIQCSTDIDLTTYIHMDVLINHPQYGEITAKRYSYKTIRDFISGSNKGYGITKFGGSSGANFNMEVVVLPFQYKEKIILPSYVNGYWLSPRIRCCPSKNTNIGGKFSTLTVWVEKIKL